MPPGNYVWVWESLTRSTEEKEWEKKQPTSCRNISHLFYHKFVFCSMVFFSFAWFWCNLFIFWLLYKHIYLLSSLTAYFHFSINILFSYLAIWFKTYCCFFFVHFVTWIFICFGLKINSVVEMSLLSACVRNFSKADFIFIPFIFAHSSFF